MKMDTLNKQAAAMAGEYYTSKYVLGKNRYSDAKIDAAFEKYDTPEMRGFLNSICPDDPGAWPC